jgi:hypothetical protein
MKTIYALDNDPDLPRMQEASLASSPIGLRKTHGLVGTAEWWQHVEAGSLPVTTTSGAVIHFSPGHHGDWPEFEMREDNGASSNWGCMVPESNAAIHFQLGNRVEVDHVQQELKSPLNGSTSTIVITEIRIGS